mmetsp:Transcript_10287/g.31454  ORF Transcript_10287/g.31454 Transcript_10287/m.31454 type:complete len:184 (-) Transcript_10287:281-832(-)
MASPKGAVLATEVPLCPGGGKGDGRATEKATATMKLGAYKKYSPYFEFGSFRTVEKGLFPKGRTGLYHGAKPEYVRLLKKPKYNYWETRVRQPSVAKVSWLSRALGTVLPFTSSDIACRRIKELGGIDSYLINEDPRLINNDMAFLYREQIRQVYEEERRQALKAREQRVKELLAERRGSRQN